MSWYDNLYNRIFNPQRYRTTINGIPTRVELDIIDSYDCVKLVYPEETNYVELQEKNFILSNVIDKIAKTFSNANFTDEKEDSELLRKINQPNLKQSKEEFLKEFAIYLLASGYTMVWKKYKSYPFLEDMQLININPDPKVTQINKDTIITEVDDKQETIRKSDVIFFYDVKKNINDDKGYSRIKPLRSQVRNIEDAQRAKNIQITNSGTTIVSPKSQPANSLAQGLGNIQLPSINTETTNVKTEKDDIEQKLNARRIHNKIIVSSTGLDSVNLSEALAKVKFYDMVEEDILAVYDAFGFPAELSPYGKNPKYENREAAENELIEKEILPLAESFTKSLNAEFEGRGSLNVDYNHLNSVANTKNKMNETNKTIVDTYSTLVEKEIITQEEAKRILEEKGVL